MVSQPLKAASSGVDFPGFFDSRETGIFLVFSSYPGNFPGNMMTLYLAEFLGLIPFIEANYEIDPQNLNSKIAILKYYGLESYSPISFSD